MCGWWRHLNALDRQVLKDQATAHPHSKFTIVIVLLNLLVFVSSSILYIVVMGKLSQVANKLYAAIKDHPINWELITCYDCWHLVERGQRCGHCGCQN